MSHLQPAREHYPAEKATYHVSGRLENVRAADQIEEGALADLFEQDDARQVLHVTFGKVVTTRAEDGSSLFKERLMHCLRDNEALHYECLIKFRQPRVQIRPSDGGFSVATRP